MSYCSATTWPLWIDPAIRDPGLLRDLLQPADELLQLQLVSALVNNVNNEGPELLRPPGLPPTDAPPLTLFG